MAVTGEAAFVIDLETGEIGLHATPTVAKDVILVGSSFKEGTQVATHNNTKGIARAFDVRTGKGLGPPIDEDIKTLLVIFLIVAIVILVLKAVD